MKIVELTAPVYDSETDKNFVTVLVSDKWQVTINESPGPGEPAAIAETTRLIGGRFAILSLDEDIYIALNSADNDAAVANLFNEADWTEGAETQRLLIKAGTTFVLSLKELDVRRMDIVSASTTDATTVFVAYIGGYEVS
jgi:hypothetical protein